MGAMGTVEEDSPGIEVTVSTLDGQEVLRTAASPTWTALEIKEAIAKDSNEFGIGTKLLLGEITLDDGQTLRSLGFAPGGKAEFNVALPGLPVGRYEYQNGPP